MRIAIVAPFNPSCISECFKGGTVAGININAGASSVNNLVVGLIESGQDVSVVTLDPSCKYNRVFKGDNVTLFLIGNQPLHNMLAVVPNLKHRCAIIRKQLRTIVNSVDIIHAHWAYEYANACLPYVRMKPVVCTYRDWPFAIINNMSKTPVLNYLVKRLLWNRRIQMSDAILRTNEVHLIANSDYMYSFLEESVSDPSRISIIYNSIADETVLKEPKYCTHDLIFVSIAASLDDERKNILNLVKAFVRVHEIHPDSKLHLIGPYHSDRAVYQFVLDNDLTKSVVFKGALSYNEVLEAIDESFCLIHPSKEESFGNTLIEAMARCKPVIGGKYSGAVPSVLDYGSCGFLCDVNSIEDITKTMIQVIEDEKTRNELVSNASMRLIDNYRNSVVVKHHISLYKSLVD